MVVNSKNGTLKTKQIIVYIHNVFLFRVLISDKIIYCTL